MVEPPRYSITPEHVRFCLCGEILLAFDSLLTVVVDILADLPYTEIEKG